MHSTMQDSPVPYTVRRRPPSLAKSLTSLSLKPGLDSTSQDRTLHTMLRTEFFHARFNGGHTRGKQGLSLAVCASQGKGIAPKVLCPSDTGEAVWNHPSAQDERGRGWETRSLHVCARNMTVISNDAFLCISHH